MAIADTFDALTSRRPYKDPYPLDVAVDIITAESGEHFDPEIVNIFIDNIKTIREIRDAIGSMERARLADFAWSGRDVAAGLDQRIMKKR